MDRTWTLVLTFIPPHYLIVHVKFLGIWAGDSPLNPLSSAGLYKEFFSMSENVFSAFQSVSRDSMVPDQLHLNTEKGTFGCQCIVLHSPPPLLHP